jgi:hypothetical protein
MPAIAVKSLIPKAHVDVVYLLHSVAPVLSFLFERVSVWGYAASVVWNVMGS